MFGEAQAQLTVRVAWDPNPESNIAGYRIYHGIQGTTQTNVIDVGFAVSGAVSNLNFSTPYWFYVTAYNVHALESDPSAVLTYRTRDRLPLSLKTDEVVLTFSPGTVQLRAEVTGDPAPGASVSIAWQQLNGPSALNLQGSSTPTPTSENPAFGSYALRVTASDGTTTDQKNVELMIYQKNPVPPPGAVIPELGPPYMLPDGLLVNWTSTPNTYYHVGFKRTLDDPNWLILKKDVFAYADSTYWADEYYMALQGGFYAIFEALP